MKLKRITTGQHFMPELDGLRFVALLPVVMLHLGTAYLKSADHAWEESVRGEWLFLARNHLEFGVNLFFGISGFILSLPFLREALGGKMVSLGAYFGRRLTRLEPPYLISLTGFFFVHILIMGAATGESLLHYLSSLFYVHNIVFGTWSTINPVAWSLEIEVQFYLLAPFLCRAYIRSSVCRRRLLIALTTLVLLRMQGDFGKTIRDAHLGMSIISHAQYFLMGILAADFWTTPRSPTLRPWVWDVVGFSSLVLWGGWPAENLTPQIKAGIGSLVVLGILLGGLKGPIFSWLLRWPPIWITGGMCYSIYLLHFPLFHLTVPFTRQLGWSDNFSASLMVQSLIHLPLAWIVCAGFYILVERPCMDRLWPVKMRGWFRTTYDRVGTYLFRI